MVVLNGSANISFYGFVTNLTLGDNSQIIPVTLDFMGANNSFLLSSTCSSCCTNATKFDASAGGATNVGTNNAISF